MRTKSIMMVVALASALGLSAGETRAATDGPSVEEIEKAGTAAEHDAIADEYAQEAARLRGEVAKHEQMLRSYERKPTYRQKGERRAGMSEHCEQLIEQYGKAADDADALAREHRRLAAEMEAEAGDAESEATQEKALAEQYTKEAARLRQEAAKHERMASAYEGRPLYRQKGHGAGPAMVQHCKNLVAKFTAAAEQADAIAKMHTEHAAKAK